MSHKFQPRYDALLQWIGALVFSYYYFTFIIHVALEKKHVEEVASFLMAQVMTCLKEAEKHKLPSAAKASIWAIFHQIRGNEQIAGKWRSFIATIPSSSGVQESALCLQLIFDRMLKGLISSKAEACTAPPTTAASGGRPIDMMESNTIRYMAGYIAVKLLKKFKKKAKHPGLQMKRRLFVGVLQGMKADNQPGQPDSPLEYTEQWTQLIDRGGLYHISDDVFKLVEGIEIAVRRHMNTGAMTTYTSNCDLRALIREDIFSSQQILSQWENLAQSIPPKYYAMELLGAVVDLWITIRGYAFSRDYTMTLERKYKKGTRKTLKPKED